MNLENIEELNCSICYETYSSGSKNPRFLTCGHSFCHGCLETVFFRNPVCPICKTKIEYDRVSSIPINYPIKSLVERMKKSMFLSSTAFAAASTSPSSLSSKAVEKEKKDDVLCCLQHKLQVTMKCETCNILICSTCDTAVVHSNCSKISIKESIKDLKARSSVLLTTASEINSRNALDAKFLSKVLETLLFSLQNEINEKAKDKEKVKKSVERNEKSRNDFKAMAVELNTFISILTSSNSYSDVEKLHKNLYSCIDYIKTQHPAEIAANSNVYVLLKTIKNTKGWFEGKSSSEDFLYGKIKIEKEKIKIYSFEEEKPKGNNILVNFREFLKLMNGSYALPSSVFFELGYANSGYLGDLIITTDNLSPRSLNFLLLSSCLKTFSYKGTSMHDDGHAAFDGGRYLKNTNSVAPPVVEGIENGGIYKSKLKRGNVYGFNANTNKDSLFAIYYSDHRDSKVYGNKFAKVDSGMDILDNIAERNRTTEDTKVIIKECGFIL